MQNKTKQIFSLSAIVLFFLLAIASNPSKMTFGNEEKWIPSEFEPQKTTLLIQKFKTSNKAQGKMEAYMEKKYPYKYEFVDVSTIIDRADKYANTSIYRYALRITSHTTTSMNGSRSMTTTGWDFYFYDRENDISYPPTKKASSYIFTTFQPVINTIIKKYE